MGRVKVMRLEDWLKICKNIPNLIVFQMPNSVVVRMPRKEVGGAKND